MNPFIVHEKHPVLLIGGAGCTKKVFDQTLISAPILVAADGAAAIALNYGRVPDFVIGDFDSLDPVTIAQIPPERMFPIPEQDHTDFHKCLSRINSPLVLAVGFTGGRIDHELAVYHGLVMNAHQPCIVIGETDICFAVRGGITMDLPKGTRVSLFPMGNCTVSATGLKWSFENLHMAPDHKIGTSNQAIGGGITVTASHSNLLCILPKAHLDQAMSALQSIVRA